MPEKIFGGKMPVWNRNGREGRAGGEPGENRRGSVGFVARVVLLKIKGVIGSFRIFVCAGRVPAQR